MVYCFVLFGCVLLKGYYFPKRKLVIVDFIEKVKCSRVRVCVRVFVCVFGVSRERENYDQDVLYERKKIYFQIKK